MSFDLVSFILGMIMGVVALSAYCLNAASKNGDKYNSLINDEAKNKDDKEV